jgi:hypothetical protein
MNFLNLLQRVSILAVLIVIILIHACTTDAHQSVRDFAISAICDFPPFSGNNMCRKADIIRFIEEDAASLASTNDGHLKCWCVELEYIDYTGERGIASVWVIESSTKGDYLLYKGPLFDMQCEWLH